ncbi:hypothetical protein B0H14DRAFT_2653299 [Mycena olivaceomarginata]|nr:hypothetical protein B0H14DRAFT_2653299 [Mycena olivaceomarginata]
MLLSDTQRIAIVEAQRLLANVGLTTPKCLPTNLDDHDPDFLEITRAISQGLPACSASAAVLGSQYCPPAAREFTSQEISAGLDCVNRQSYVHRLVDHPLGSIVEYPETGTSIGTGIAHRFSVDSANFHHPRESFQYSLGDSHGGDSHVHCGQLLLGRTGLPAVCFHKKLSCKGLKYCSARSLHPLAPALQLDAIADAKKEIFVKTLGLYCVLAEKGCAFDLRVDGEDLDSIGLTDNNDADTESESDDSDSETHTKVIRDSRRKKPSRSFCKGKLEMCFDEYQRSFIQCEHRENTDKAHLILRTLDEFDITYLHALLKNDLKVIDEREELARQFGYGPRAPCSFTASPSAQKELCPYWHRDSGKLARGVLQRTAGNCTAKFDIYTPDDLSDCPLGWTKPFDPPLAALHPSLGNLDHIRRYIDGLRKVLSYLPQNIVVSLKGNMFEREWQEFEMETWEVDHMKSIIGTRAFTTSQSAEAHLILFTRIFEIAHADTGIPCRFRHIHGEGFEIWITDAHKGQALGVGMYCQKLCAHLGDVYCPMEPARLLRSLDPCDHLRRFLRLCTTHYKRNIRELRPYTTQQVRAAMLSLSSSQVHPDLESAFRIIENGGRKAKAWLKDKRTGSKFALPALYQSHSLIPLEIWKSAPSTSNGNEQSHRNVNRDGVNLTMLGGIMRGMQYDARAMGALELHASQGIYARDQTATHFRRQQRSVNRHVIVQTRVAQNANEESAAAHTASGENTTSDLSPTPMNSRRSQAMNTIPLFTTAPMVHPQPHLNHTAPEAAWFTEQMERLGETPMQVDIRPIGHHQTTAFEPQRNFGGPSSLAIDTDGVTIFNPECLRDYPATYGFPTYPFDPTILDTSVELATLDTPYLHILSDHTPSAAGFSSRVFTDYNS